MIDKKSFDSIMLNNTLNMDKNFHEYNRNFISIVKHIDNFLNIHKDNAMKFIGEDGLRFYLYIEDFKFIMERPINSNDRLDESLSKIPEINGKKFKSNNSESIIITKSLFNSHNYISYLNYNVFSFESDSFRENSYFQLIFKISKKIRYDYIFEPSMLIYTEIQFEKEKISSVSNGIEFKINNINFILYSIKDYLVIENKTPIKFEEFNKYSRTIISILGLISGYNPGGIGFFFSFCNKEFYNFNGYAIYLDFLDAYDNSRFQVIDLNSYNYISHDTISKIEDMEDIEKNAAEITDNLNSISVNVFSKLCELNLTNDDIAKAIDLIFEANNSNSINTQGILLSVAIETLTNFIYLKEKNKMNPIENKEIAKKFINKIHKIGKDDINDYENNPIKNKIDNINSPTNKDKLVKSFEILGIQISEDDKNIINNRNLFLHGSYKIKAETIESLLPYMIKNEKIRFLVYAILLKIAGHKGNIVDFGQNASNINKKYYRNIGN